MNPHLKIAIQNPCHQNYAEMQVGKLGRHCTHCSKEVIDFTSFTTVELMTYFQNSTGTVCGRLTSEQLSVANRVYKSKMSWQKKVGVLIATSLTLFTTQISAAENSGAKIETHYSERAFKNILGEKRLPDSLKISGKVIEQGTNDPLPGAFIKVKGTNIVTTTNANGEFNLVLQESDRSNIVLQAGFLGYEMKEQKLIKGKLQTITLELAASFMGEVVVVRKHENLYMQLFQKLKRLF